MNKPLLVVLKVQGNVDDFERRRKQPLMAVLHARLVGRPHESEVEWLEARSARKRNGNGAADHEIPDAMTVENLRQRHVGMDTLAETVLFVFRQEAFPYAFGSNADDFLCSFKVGGIIRLQSYVASVVREKLRIVLFRGQKA